MVVGGADVIKGSSQGGDVGIPKSELRVAIIGRLLIDRRSAQEFQSEVTAHERQTTKGIWVNYTILLLQIMRLRECWEMSLESEAKACIQHSLIYSADPYQLLTSW